MSLSLHSYAEFDFETNTAFPGKLFYLLENNSNSDVIGWLPNGFSFGIFDQARFIELLPLYFKHKKLSSFQRQLNLYGFRRDKQQSSYFHPKFQRGRRDLISSIRRLPSKSSMQFHNREIQTQKSASECNRELYLSLKGSTLTHQRNTRYQQSLMQSVAALQANADLFPESDFDVTSSAPLHIRNLNQDPLPKEKDEEADNLPNTWMNVHHHYHNGGVPLKRVRALGFLDEDFSDNKFMKQEEPLRASNGAIVPAEPISGADLTYATLKNSEIEVKDKPIMRIPLYKPSNALNSTSEKDGSYQENENDLKVRKSGLTAKLLGVYDYKGTLGSSTDGHTSTIGNRYLSNSRSGLGANSEARTLENITPPLSTADLQACDTVGQNLLDNGAFFLSSTDDEELVALCASTQETMHNNGIQQSTDPFFGFAKVLDSQEKDDMTDFLL